MSNTVLHESVSDGKCFSVKRQEKGQASNDLSEQYAALFLHQDDHQDEVAPNWLCEDDLENFWLRNCFVLHPTITTCMDELAILKHTGDVTNLELAMKRQFEEQQK